MKKLLLSLTAIACLGLVAARPAQAVVVSTWLEFTPNSSIEIFLDALGGTTTAATTLNVLAGSTIHVTLDNVGVDALALSIDDADINLSDGTLDLQLGVLGGVTAATFGLGVSAVSGALTPLGGNMFDAGGTTLALDQGIITYEGTGFAGTLLDPGTFDFVTDPLALDVPGGAATVKIFEEAVSPTKNNVTLVIPISVTQSLTSDTTDINATINALLIATGMKVIPEPTTFVLLGIGVAGFIAVARRRRQK